MSDFEAKFKFEENDPINATFKAYDEAPTIGGSGTNNYNLLNNKPSINDVELVGNKSLDELGIQSKGDYVKNTDYATDSKVGLVKGNSVYGITVFSGGMLVIQSAGGNDIENKSNQFRPITPKNMDYALKKSITTNIYELTDDEKTNAKNWLGYATPADIMQAIASIPQFKLSIVDELPMTGEKMTLYFVPKEGADNDIYNEYVWIEQTSSYEFLGSTAVDLTDYVKKTDIASASKTGIVKGYLASGFSVNGVGEPYGATKTLEQYNTAYDMLFISKGTLDNVLTQYAKTVSLTQAEYDALETKDANTLYLIEES